jgi:hypothetical protein
VKEIPDKLKEIVSEHNENSGIFTREVAERMIRGMMNDQTQSLMQYLGNNRSDIVGSSPRRFPQSQAPITDNAFLRQFRNGFKDDFTIPKGSYEMIWYLWWRGKNGRTFQDSHPPLRLLEAVTIAEQKKLNKVKTIIERLVQTLEPTEIELLKREPALNVINDLLKKCIESDLFRPLHSMLGERTKAWGTVYNSIRKAQYKIITDY